MSVKKDRSEQLTSTLSKIARTAGGPVILDSVKRIGPKTYTCTFHASYWGIKSSPFVES